MKKYISIVAIGMLLIAACASEEEQTTTSEHEVVNEVSKGQRLFNDYCLQCHSLTTDKIGPALKGSLEHWDNDTTRISAFIRNARKTIDSGDPRAVEIAKEWDNALMTSMPHLTDEDIAALLEYMAK